LSAVGLTFQTDLYGNPFSTVPQTIAIRIA
jgi:hypothetical protein